MNKTVFTAVPSDPAENLHCSVSRAESEVVVCLEGDLDLATAERVDRLLREVLEQRPTTVDVDLARLSFLDSTGIHCLVNAADAAASVGCKFVVRRPSARVVRLLGICGVDEFLLDDADGDMTARR